MKNNLLVCYGVLFLLLSVLSSNNVQAQFKLKFYVSEYETGCGCFREGCIASTPLSGGGITYYFNGVKETSTGRWIYELDLAEDPRNLRWNYVHIPAVPSVCNSPFFNCWFSEGINLPLYSGPESCGTTYFDRPSSSTNGRGLYVRIEFSAPQMTTPTIVGGGRLDNICRDEVTLQTTRWLDETYVWQVSRSVTGPWASFDTTSGVGANRTIINRQVLGDALGDANIEGDELQVRVRPAGSTACWFDRASPPPSLTVFQSGAPTSITRTVSPPSCRNGNDGNISITSLRNSDGSLFQPSGDLKYSLTAPNNSGYDFTSIANTNISIAAQGIPVVAGTWQLAIEGVGLTCSLTTSIVVPQPALMNFQSAAVTQAIVCAGGTGAVRVSMNNGSGSYTYTIRDVTIGTTFVPRVATTTTSTHVFNTLPPGNYQVRVQSCGQDITSTTINLSPPTSVLTMSPLLATNISCVGQVNGTIQVEVSLGTPSYTIQLDGGGFVGMSGGTTHVFNSLSTGSHAVVVRDANGCSVSQSINVGVNDLITGVVLPADLKPVTCAAGSNGEFRIQASGSAGVAFEYSINGQAFQSLNIFSNLSAATYTIAVRDANAIACGWNGTVEITEPLPIQIDEFIITENIPCHGEASGEMKALASGGTPQFGYNYFLLDQISGISSNLSSFSAVVFEDLRAGNYRLTVSDGTVNCFVTSDMVLTQPEEVLFHATESNYNGSSVSCANSSDGLVSFKSTGSFYPHTISVSGRPNQIVNNSTEIALFDNFQSGDYFFTITSNNGACENDTLIHFIAPQPLVIDLTAEEYGDAFQISCHGLSDGIVSTEVSGGTTPYTYTIMPNGIPLTHANTNLDSVGFENLSAGTYTIMLNDANNCQIQDEIILTEPDELIVAEITRPDIYGRQLTCHGDQNATATVYTMGGSYPQKITLQSTTQQGISNGSTEGVVFSNLGAGNYSVEIVDEEGCTTTGTFDVVEPDAVTLDNSQTVIQRPDCAGQQTGSLELQANGGIAIGTTGSGTNVINGTDYSYQLTFLGDRSRLPFPYPEQQNETGNPVNFDQLVAGNYQLLLTDQVGCSVTESITIATNNQVIANVSTTDITCKADEDGSANVSITGGVAPYQVNWNYQNQTIDTQVGINENQATAINNLKSGFYSFEISDANGCAYYTGNDNFQIESPAEDLVLKSTTTNVICHGDNNGLIILNAEGGWQESNYRFGTDVNNLTVNNTMHEDLQPGTYRYFVQDNRGCVDTLDVTIIEPDMLESSILNVTNVSCYGLSDGAFELTIEGGITPYQLSVDNGMTWIEGSSMQLLNANTYATQIRDANNCLIHQNVIITEPTILNAVLVSQENTLCKQATGSATVNVTGGSSPYNFSWTNSESQIIETSLTATNLFAGNYIFQVKDDHACQYDLPVTIINTNDIVFDVINIEGVKCFGASNGSAELSITTIQSPYTILWDNGSTINATLSLPAGNRSVLLEDANQCQVEKAFVVPSPEALSFNITEEIAPTCFGVCNGVLDVSATGGTGSYSYIWSNGETSKRITNICAGEYTLTITDVNDCVLEETITFQGPSQNMLGIEDETYYICQGQKVNINLDNWTDILWSSVNGFTSSLSAVELSQAGNYSVMVRDGAGCISQANFKVVYSKDLLKAEFLVPRETYVGDTVVCVNISIPQPDLLVWDFDRVNAKNVGSKAGYQQLVFLKEGEYEITLFSHLGGCVDRQTKTILVLQSKGDDDPDLDLGYEETGIKEVTVFPNPNDGRFTCDVRLHKVQDVHLKVLNLNGNVLAEHSDYKTDHLQTELDIDKQPSGLYWLVVEIEGDMKIVKVLVR